MFEVAPGSAKLRPIARSVIRNHMKDIYSNLSSGSQRLLQATLRICTALVTFSPDIAREFVHRFHFGFKHFGTIAAMRSGVKKHYAKGKNVDKYTKLRLKQRERQLQERRIQGLGTGSTDESDVRTCFIRFIAHVLCVGYGEHARHLSGFPAIFQAIYKGFHADGTDSIVLWLRALYTGILRNPAIVPSLKATVIPLSFVSALPQLYQRSTYVKTCLTAFLKAACAGVVASKDAQTKQYDDKMVVLMQYSEASDTQKQQQSADKIAIRFLTSLQVRGPAPVLVLRLTR